MKISSLFELIRSSNEVAEYFDGVDSPEQMVSRLERLKKAAPTELMEDVRALRNSVSMLLDDTLEMGRSVNDEDENEDEDEEDDLTMSDSEIQSLLDEDSKPENEDENEGTKDEEAKPEK